MLDALRRANQPLAPSRVAEALGAARGAVRTIAGLLRELEAQGRVERHRGRYRLARRDGLVEATLVTGGSGPGVLDASGRRRRVRGKAAARAGDRVLVQPLEGDEVEILHVVDGFRDRWIGIFRRNGASAWIAPYRDSADWEVRVARSDTGGAEPGEVVAALPVERRTRRRRRTASGTPWARVVERLGRPGSPDADFAAVVWRHRLPVHFPRAALEQADALSGTPDPAEIERRVDLRERVFVTIDPADARDHDDAVCVEAAPGGGWRLWVAIADVAEAVAAGSPIDLEALRRGNSVYFPDRAIPMLPERLSGDVCSLRPQRDRLAMVVELHFDGRARVVRRSFYPAVIHSRARLVYDEVTDAIEGRAGGQPQAEVLAALGALTSKLGRSRRRAGSLDFELPEPAFTWGRDGRPVDVQPAQRNAAHRAVEEAMLAANRAVAELLVGAGRVAIHRIHEPPAGPELEMLVERLAALGLLPARRGAALEVASLARVLSKARGHPAERCVHFAALRAMKQARYSASSEGHYALGFEHYLHFTSPIRRYADLMVHRALKATLAGDPPPLGDAEARRIAGRISFRERLAVGAERERADMARCVFMASHLGESVEGTVTGVAPHGLYVTLEPWFVEGLIHVSRLDGYYEPDALGVALCDAASGERHALGDRLRVLVAEADPVRGRIDLLLEAVVERAAFRGQR